MLRTRVVLQENISSEHKRGLLDLSHCASSLNTVYFEGVRKPSQINLACAYVIRTPLHLLILEGILCPLPITAKSIFKTPTLRVLFFSPISSQCAMKPTKHRLWHLILISNRFSVTQPWLSQSLKAMLISFDPCTAGIRYTFLLAQS